MQIPKNVETTEIGIGGVDGLAFPVIFGEGHTCNANEAHALNQLNKENARNNLRERVKKAVKEGADKPKVQEILDDYLRSYDFGKPGGGGGRVTDPIMAEALDQAKKIIRKALIQKGVKISTVSTAEMNEKAKLLVERRPALLEEAKKVVAKREKDMDEALALVDAG